MGKRGNGEGSISRRKNGGWMGQYVVYTAEGRKRKTVYGKTRKEVAAKLAKEISNRESGLTFDARNLTVGGYLDLWLRDSVQDTVRLTTYQGYERVVRLHIKPALGRVKLDRLTPAHVRGLYRERLEAGLAPRMVQLVHAILHKALGQAVNDGLIPRNVTETVKAPRPVKKEMRPLSPAQARTLLQAARGDRLEALYTLALTTGMRQGELLGLKWEDIDLEGGILQVRRTLSTATGGGFGFNPPKTAKSRRSIRLPELALSSLRRHRRSQLEERMKLAGLWQDHDLVFTTGVGTPMSRADLITRSFKPLLRRAGLPDIRFHDLRHTCATLLLSRGAHAKLVQELLGHSTIAMTLDTYSHVLPGMSDGLANTMDEVLG
ncbi:Tn916 family transposase [Rubrobacter xylanophilus DSM 9941]|uniref:tyrosine-type recombinase/integrase n=1 Tax=Rubrobacter xylanophilus TaxID=49319 RepID=UPI001F37787E|nr:site-specific integrase [Rubrobacter xylanophilus]QYJ15625.1 Tn916 family transposase [Rubrobacter xylanophilus DSM 9941]